MANTCENITVVVGDTENIIVITGDTENIAVAVGAVENIEVVVGDTENIEVVEGAIEEIQVLVTECFGVSEVDELNDLSDVEILNGQKNDMLIHDGNDFVNYPVLKRDPIYKCFIVKQY